jgi:hypothetical protein
MWHAVPAILAHTVPEYPIRKLLLHSVTIRRHPNQFRAHLPVPWMRVASTRADRNGTRHRDAQRRHDDGVRDPFSRWYAGRNSTRA